MLHAPNRLILQFVDKSNFSKYESKTGHIKENEVYPLKLILLSCDKCNNVLYQRVMVENESQKTELLKQVLGFANVIYECDFVNGQSKAEQDYIISPCQLHNLFSQKNLNKKK